jgi:hypothetical protein
MNAYKDMLDNVVSPITCVSMNHQNQLKQMANGAMFATSRKDQIDHWTLKTSELAPELWIATQSSLSWPVEHGKGLNCPSQFLLEADLLTLLFSHVTPVLILSALFLSVLFSPFSVE